MLVHLTVSGGFVSAIGLGGLTGSLVVDSDSLLGISTFMGTFTTFWLALLLSLGDASTSEDFFLESRVLDAFLLEEMVP